MPRNGAFPLAGVLKRASEEFDTLLAPVERKLLDFSRSPDGGAVALAGQPGTGKSRLLARLAEKLKPTHSVRVQSAKPMERDWPYSGVSAFVAGLDGPKGTEFDSLLRASSAGTGDRNTVASELLSLIRGQRHHDLIVVLDDFDRLDAVSQEVLGFILGRLSGTGLRVVASVTGSRLPAVLEGTPTVALGRLSTRQLADLCSHAAGPAAEPSALHMIALGSHGNPAFALSVLDRLPVSQVKGLDPLILPFVGGSSPDSGPVTAGGQLPEQQRWLLQLLSTARTTPRRLLESLVVDAADALEALEHAGLVGASESGYHLVTILDARIRSASYWAMTPDQRRLLHQQLAEHAEPDFPQAALWHCSFLAGASALASKMMRVACDLAKERRPIDAVEYAERALVLGAPQSPDFAPLGARLSLWLMASGELAAALRYGELSSGHRMDAGSRIDLALATDSSAMLTRLRTTTNVLEEAVRTGGAQAPDNAVRALTLKAMLHLELWESVDAGRLLGAAQELLSSTDEVQGELHRALGLVLDTLNRRETRIEGHTGISATRHPGLPRELILMARARALSHAERYLEAGHLLDLVLDGEAELPAMWRQAAHSFAMENEILAGNHARAMDRFEALAPSVDSHQLQPPTQILLKLWHLHASGDVSGAAEFIDGLRSGKQFAAIDSVSARAAAHAGSFALMRGDIEAAGSHLGLALRSTASSEAPHLLRATGDAIEALVLQGHQRAAARVLDRYEAQVEELPTRWLRLSLAKARAVAGDPNRADANFGLARAQWAQVDGHFELGRIMLSHAQALLRVARIPDATEQFKRAAAAFTSAGAIGWANRCAELMASTASPDYQVEPPATRQLMETLTVDERIVVQRVLDGQRNKDIAREVHVSLRTVELRLTSVYRKFGARSRSHLAALLTSTT